MVIIPHHFTNKIRQIKESTIWYTALINRRFQSITCLKKRASTEPMLSIQQLVSNNTWGQHQS